MKQETKQELQALGVHDLRVLARNLGIARPTTKLKDQLIQEIGEVLSSGQKVDFPDIRGRRAVPKLANMQNTALALPEEIQCAFATKDFVIRGLCSGIYSLSQNINDSMITFAERKGFVRMFKDYFYFIDDESDRFVYVPTELANESGLVCDDHVTAKCAISPAVDFCVASKIQKINGFAPSPKRKFCDFDNLASPRAKRFQSGTIKEGVLNYDEDQGSFDNIENLVEALKTFQSKGFSVMLFGSTIHSTMVNQLWQAVPQTQEFVISQYIPEKNMRQFVSMVRNMIMRARQGEKMLIVCFDLQEILNDVEHMAVGSELQLESRHITPKRIRDYGESLCRILANGGSITTVFLHPGMKPMAHVFPE